jgi:hypothetical protein
VDPITEALDVRSGFQSYIRVSSPPFRYTLGLAIVIQIAFDEHDQPFTLDIDVDRADDKPVMHHQDFTFEIPFGIRAMNGFSRDHPFAFTLQLEFYDVGLHSVIIGDGDSDLLTSLSWF